MATEWAPAYCACGKELAKSPYKRSKSGLCHACIISRPFSEDHKRKISDALKGHEKSESHRAAISEACKSRYSDPKQVPWWKGGKRTFYHNIARQVMGVSDPNIVVHHIDGNYENNAPENLMVMSDEDHTALHNLQGDRLPCRK